eukprot:4818617-Pyramimonas_sp.AAC.1
MFNKSEREKDQRDVGSIVAFQNNEGAQQLSGFTQAFPSMKPFEQTLAPIPTSAGSSQFQAYEFAPQSCVPACKLASWAETHCVASNLNQMFTVDMHKKSA